MADLTVGFEVFLEFAKKNGIVSEARRTELLHGAHTTLLQIAEKQQDSQRDADPILRFLDLLRSAMSTGKAHVTAKDGRSPAGEIAHHLGWTANQGRGNDARPQGDHIGYVTEDELWLLPTPSYCVIKQLAERTDEPLCLAARTLWKRLAERGLLLSADSDKRQTTKRLIHGRRPRVLVLSLSDVLPEESGQSGQGEVNTDLTTATEASSPDLSPESENKKNGIGAENRGSNGQDRGISPTAPIAPLYGHKASDEAMEPCCQDGDREYLEERAANQEFEGSVSREEAERLALDGLRRKRLAGS